jgi:hypothetical protein
MTIEIYETQHSMLKSGFLYLELLRYVSAGIVDGLTAGVRQAEGNQTGRQAVRYA